MSCKLLLHFSGYFSMKLSKNLGFCCMFSSFSVLPESSAVSVSVSPYSNSKLGDSMELCERCTHEHTLYCSMTLHSANHRCPDTHMQIDILKHKLFTFCNTNHYSELIYDHPHTQTHTHSSGSSTVLPHHVYFAVERFGLVAC